MEEHSIQCICSFASSTYLKQKAFLPVLIPPIGAFKAYGKRTFDYMKTTMEALQVSRNSSKENLKLKKPYNDKVKAFSCCSFNLGEQFIFFLHLNDGNLAQLWCSITPVGWFDPRIGGHIVLWDYRLVVEFPPGSTMLLPSALVRYSNISIHPGESCYSIIQYMSGGLFHWVHNGCMSECDWLSQASEKDLRKHQKEQDLQLSKAMKMFTTLDELVGKAKEKDREQEVKKGIINLKSLRRKEVMVESF